MQNRVITSTIGPIIDDNGDYTNDEEQISNILNTFFASVFTVEDLSDIPTVPAAQINNNDVLSSITITESDLSKCIDKLKVRTSPAPDMISPRILKPKSELVKPLIVLFNNSLQFGTVSDEWKVANETLFFKKRQ